MSCFLYLNICEIDQLYKICSVLGAPNWSVFPDANNHAQLVNICHSQILPVNLSDIIPNASWEAVDLIGQLCSWDPLKRPTAEQALQHPFFNVASWVPRPIHDPLQNKPEYTKTKQDGAF
ncbi:cyclin-dependent kinase F-3-like isoform X3 [Chenopodium quinoa]|uniref:cyclin-dependent kinase F-3-like isoform X3 n=1 Tax=Chenopodium quinoa TaxID=63459 RepID=UPI000B771AF1|nr:cyclin-dependent kinase F-3-like isoform X3 [Chenopodium quinoa]